MCGHCAAETSEPLLSFDAQTSKATEQKQIPLLETPPTPPTSCGKSFSKPAGTARLRCSWGWAEDRRWQSTDNICHAASANLNDSCAQDSQEGRAFQGHDSLLGSYLVKSHLGQQMQMLSISGKQLSFFNPLVSSQGLLCALQKRAWPGGWNRKVCWLMLWEEGSHAMASSDRQVQFPSKTYFFTL